MDHKADDTWTLDALQRDDVDVVRQRVLNDPAYLGSRDHFRNTPLRAAIEFLQVDLVRFMLQHGADPNVEFDDGYSCLLSAIESDGPASLEIVEALIAAGADLQRTGINGWTPLHMAAARGQLEKTRLLLEAGARVNQRTEIDGCETPLLEAAAQGHPEVVQLLLDYGADPTMRDSVHNFTPLEKAQDAARGADPDIVEYLKSHDFHVDPDEILADLDLLSDDQKGMLKAAYMNFDMAEHYRESADQLARERDHEGVIRILSQRAEP